MSFSRFFLLFVLLGSHVTVAEGSNWQRMGDRFSGPAARISSADIAWMVGACLAAGALIWLLNWAARRDSSKVKPPNPKALLRQLCRCHGLSRRDRQLLERLATLEGLAQPAELFLRPELFEAEGLPEELDDEADEIGQIAAVLFAESSTEDSVCDDEEIEAEGAAEEVAAEQPAATS